MCGNPFLLNDGLRKLRANGSVLNTLRARRETLDQQIAVLERRQGQGEAVSR